MSMTLLVAAVALATSPFVLWWALAGQRFARRPTLGGVAGLAGAPGGSVASGGSSGGGVLGQQSKMVDVESQLARAGLTGRVAPAQLATIRLLTLIAGAAAAAGVVLVFGLSILPLTGAGVLVLTGALGPGAWLNRRADKRQVELANTLPDALDQLSILARAGLGFQAALTRTAAAVGDPLSEELGRTVQDLEIGVSRNDAFAGLVARTGAPDIKRLVLALEQASAVGAPVSGVLDAQSVHLRVLRELRAEERAAKLPVKLSLPLVLCILPTLFVIILGPAMIRIFDTWA
jgi:tight adherence protein C